MHRPRLLQCISYDEALKEKWGADYEANLARITGAVLQTDGICLSYNNEPIFAAFHSSSVRKTENSESVWRNALPYLRSASSIEDEDSVPNYISRVNISTRKYRALLKKLTRRLSFQASLKAG
jgi:stage II sporulation protein D